MRKLKYRKVKEFVWGFIGELGFEFKFLGFKFSEIIFIVLFFGVVSFLS